MSSTKSNALKVIMRSAVFQHYNSTLMKWTILLKKQFHGVGLKKCGWEG
jgi:hypothetical protein